MATAVKRRKPLSRRARFPARQWHQAYARALEPKLTAYGKKLVQACEDKGVIAKFSTYLLDKYDHDPEQVRSAVRRDDFKPDKDQAKLEQLAKNVLAAVSVNLEPVVEKFTRDIFTAASKHAFAKLGVTTSWNVKTPQFEAALEARKNLIGGATDFQARRVLSAIRQEVYDNGGHPLSSALLDKVKATVGDISEDRARTIARTETTAIQGKAARTVYEENGLSQEWLYSQSGYERHMSLDGQIAGPGEKFVAEDGTELEYPGDENAGAAMAANCMCSLMPVLPSGFDLDPDEAETGD